MNAVDTGWINDENPREKITWAHFDLEWLTEGKDRL